MKYNYTDEKNAQIIITLLKQSGIRKIIASPGTTNMALVVSMQSDPYFEMYSSVDERSAAYLACGLAGECGEPVVISCTGATASRNYLSGLTEAFYRKLPILAITSTQIVSRVGHHVAQVIDRSSVQNDVVNLSLTLPVVKDDDTFWECEIKVNRAILELTRNGGGPVHLNLPTTYSQSFNITDLPKVRKIHRYVSADNLPSFSGQIAVFIGSHFDMSHELVEAIDLFCAVNNAVVFCDHTSGYKGKFRVLFTIPGCQHNFDTELAPDLIIHMGEVSGDYYGMAARSKEVWRLSEDGELRDTFRKLSNVFQMRELEFFRYYSDNKKVQECIYLRKCIEKVKELNSKIPDLPFSNIWMASVMSSKIPQGATIHFGILNSLRSWNFFELPQSVKSASNVGGFGIDGGLSTLIGASLGNQNKLFFGVFGDLAFFYDLNVLGNRHLGKNLRILLVNNGKGTEFRQYNHHAFPLGEEAENFVAAAGHFGNKSKNLVKNFVEDLGLIYLSAYDKESFLENMQRFINPGSRSIVFEVFTNSEDESNALKLMMNIESSIQEKAKEALKELVGSERIKGIKRLLGK